MPLEKKPGDLVRADEGLPLAERLGPQERPAGEVARGGLRLRREGVRGDRRSASASMASCSRSSATRSTSGASPARLPASARAARARRASRSAPSASMRARTAATASRASPSIARIEGALGDRDQVVPLGRDAGLREQSLDVLEHVGAVGGIGRHPVDDDDERQAAVAGLGRGPPRDAVGVAGGRGHEDPEVGGLGQTVGQLAIGVLDRVDVGRIDQGDALGRTSRSTNRRRPAASADSGRPSPTRLSRAAGRATTTTSRVVGRITLAGLRRKPARALSRLDFRLRSGR